MTVKVRMDFEVPTTLDLMQASTDKVGVRDKPLDPREPLEEVHESGRVQFRKQVPRRLAHRRIVLRGQLAFQGTVKRLPI